VGGLLDRVLLDVGHDHIGAAFRERGGDAEADAFGTTRYDRHLSIVREFW